MILKDIKEYTASLKRGYKEKIQQMDAAPSLAIIRVGDVEASKRYVRNKIKDCNEVGIIAEAFEFKDTITTNELVASINRLQEEFNGIIVQLPLPDHIEKEKILAAIKPEKDVDGFRVDSCFKPATPLGIMMYLNYCNFDLTGKDVTIIGRSDLVGRPLAAMMTAADATVTLCHSKSKLSKHIHSADLIVTAVGKAGLLNCYPIYVPVIDVGINFNAEGKMCGDCINIEGRDVTPVPGGVGLLTRCALLDNVIHAKEIQNGN